MNEKKTILIEHENNMLVRVNSVEELGDKKYNLVSYEIWTDRDKFNEGIYEEWKEDGQYIYCTNYATTDEESMLQTFKRQFL